MLRPRAASAVCRRPARCVCRARRGQVSVAVVLLENEGLHYLQKRGYYTMRLGTAHDDYLAWRPDLVRERWGAAEEESRESSGRALALAPAPNTTAARGGTRKARVPFLADRTA